MKNNIRTLSAEEEPAVFHKVRHLFREMYDFMSDKGLSLPLAQNGEELWLNSVKGSLGKLNIIFVAEENGEIIGFSAGNVRLAPNYLGNKKIGYVSHVYVEPAHRKKKLGDDLARNLEEWFRKKKVDFIELEVLQENHVAKRFWEKLGFEQDYLKMIKK